jgi:hypothetical protein
MGSMKQTAGVWVLAVGGLAFLAVVIWVRPRVSGSVGLGLVAVCSAVLASGGLLVQHDPGVAAWVLTPPVVAFLGVVHVRAMFAGSGPLRI